MQDRFHLTKEQNLFLAKKVLVSNIYNSARLEGINTTYPDTKTILEGVNVPTLKLDEINCILNLRDAWNYTLTNIDAEINLDFICKVNSFVSRNESLEWGVLRNGKVGINGVDYIPDIPNEKDIASDIENILKEDNTTLKSIDLMLYLMRSQIFWDGNKRTSMIVANKILIQNGCGIITVKEEYIKEFNTLLTEYYNTGNKDKITKFLYDKCIYGLELE
ncbi:MAG TPA: Fic family protein [Candidatus Aphodocola excrementigallinarum]|uniref:Fic family protein n=1 Tax=Candidatus Aphodocola excrementigallinarum TaxID=2840670 RepID=A0A9D1ILZ0_9FIRM|nr:Fic family protein [Candidatus Aphodocola excrementigallinarum]